jgi:hypothetical protein
MNPRHCWRSVFSLPLGAVILLTAHHGAAQSTFVVPGGLANTEGNSSMSDVFTTTSSFRMQQVFDASEFAFLGGGTGQINNLSFRLDGTATDSPTYTYGNVTIRLCTTAKTPDSLTPVFSENLGPDALTVFTGSATFGSAFLPAPSPQQFFTQFNFATAFRYSAAMGNLLVDIQAGGADRFGSGGLDAQAVAGDFTSRVFATSALNTSGTLDTSGLVTRFGITPVPEPAPILLTALGVAVFLFRRRALC